MGGREDAMTGRHGNEGGTNEMMKRDSTRASHRRIRIRAVLLGLLLIGAPGLASAAPDETWGYDLSHELMSPFCPGRTLATCPSPQAAELVQWIVMQEAAGTSRAEVIDMLIERHGEEILGAPPAKGITLWAYVFPVLGFLLGGGVAFVVLRRIVRGERTGSSASSGDRAPLRPAEPRPSEAGVRPASAAERATEEDDLARVVDAELAGRSV